MNLIGLVGFKSSGKSETAKVLIKHGNFIEFSFADSLKDICSSLFCWDRDKLNGTTPEDRIWRETIDTWWAEKLQIPEFTPRYAMQNIGTEIFRKHFNYDIWTLNIEKKITQYQNHNVVVSDARFKNELNLLRKYSGKIYRIRRYPEPEWFDVAVNANLGDKESIELMQNKYGIHQSEWDWVGEKFDILIENDDNLLSLEDKVIKVFGL